VTLPKRLGALIRAAASALRDRLLDLALRIDAHHLQEFANLRLNVS